MSLPVHLSRLAAYRIPTDKPEADGTLTWDATTLVVVELQAASGEAGSGFAYATQASALLLKEILAPVIEGANLFDHGAIWQRMVGVVRNAGRAGVAANAISAVDVALWDLRARVDAKPLFRLLPAFRESVPVYGSGGFTSYSCEELCDQMEDWVAAGIPLVKMKVGKDWGSSAFEDVERVGAVRGRLGDGPEVFVDANGAYNVRQAIEQAHRFRDLGVTYFEEPVSSDHLEQLRAVRSQSGIDIAAGEYGYDPWYFRRMLEAEAVDILQADVTRCLGITGFLQTGVLAQSFATRFSAHTSPSIHAHAACAVPQISHVEFFHDHARIERMLFDGFIEPRDGRLCPDPSRPGLGLDFKITDAERWQVWP
jgi:L-alanine-DL-glutamate epimerase-like enolase superfamily enzyme